MKKTFFNKHIPSFQLESEQILNHVKKSISENETELDKIIKIKASERTFKNTIEALQISQGTLFNQCNPLCFLSLVSPRKEIREAATESKKLFERQLIKNNTKKAIFDALEEFKSHNDVGRLNEEERRLFDKYYEDYLRLGMNLEESKREKVSDLRIKISELSMQYNKHISDDNTILIFDKNQLEGMDQDFLGNLPKTEDGKYKGKKKKNSKKKIQKK